MGVNHSADVFKCAVKHKVRRRVARGVKPALNALARFQVNHHHIVWGHLAVINARRLYHNKPLFAVDSRNVAPSVNNEIVLGKLHIRFVNLLL